MNPVLRSNAALICHCTNLERGDRSTREAFPGSTPFPKITFSVYTGMLTGLCSINAFVLWATFAAADDVPDSERYKRRRLIPQCCLHTLIFPGADVRTTRPYHEGLVQTLSSACNSSTTLDFRDAIRKKGRDRAGISLPPIEDLSSSASDDYKTDEWCLFCPLPPLTRPLAPGIVFELGIERCKYIAGTKARDGNASNTLVSA